MRIERRRGESWFVAKFCGRAMRWKKGEGVVGERDTAGMWIGNGFDSEEDMREAMVETYTTLTAAER